MRASDTFFLNNQVVSTIFMYFRIFFVIMYFSIILINVILYSFLTDYRVVNMSSN